MLSEAYIQRMNTAAGVLKHRVERVKFLLAIGKTGIRSDNLNRLEDLEHKIFAALYLQRLKALEPEISVLEQKTMRALNIKRIRTAREKER